MAFADNVGAVPAYHLPDGTLTSTIESKTNFFHGVAGHGAAPASRSRRRHPTSSAPISSTTRDVVAVAE